MSTATFPMGSNLRAACRALALVLSVLLVLPFILLTWALRLDGVRGKIIQHFYKVGARICGLRVHVTGTLCSERPFMLVSNHSSYLDVFVLGQVVPLSFTPKKEVRGWPVIGFLCVLADCIFVERRPTEMQAAAAQMQKRLSKGKVLCLFPEGTTSDGFHVKPFKSGFLSLAEVHRMPVQPASIAYTHIGREPITAERREEVAWVGDATFFGHFWHFLSLPPVRVEVALHPAQHIEAFGNRKALTQACEQHVVMGLGALFAQQEAA